MKIFLQLYDIFGLDMSYNNIIKDIIINHKEDEMREELEQIIEDIGYKALSTKRNSQNDEKGKFSELFNRLKQKLQLQLQ